MQQITKLFWFTSRWIIAFAVLVGLNALICTMIWGKLPSTDIWRGVFVALAVAGSLAMARGARITAAR